MAKYYYNKYLIATATRYNEASWGSDYNTSSNVQGYYRYYGFNNVTNAYYNIGSPVGNIQTWTGDVFYYSAGSFVERHVVTSNADWTSRVRGNRAYKYTNDSTTYLEYSRGSLIESNIIAENGTYPTNGRSGGYWWVRGSAVPLPTTPSSIAAPTPLKSGESITISWGASTNATSYQLERSLNSGAYVEIYSGADLNFEDTVPKGTLTVQYRVKASGPGGDSAYQTGVLITVVNFPEIYENIGGVYKAYEAGWENVGGTWKEIDSIWENINGTWVEL